MAEKTILSTTTGEYYQPVRLHYQVQDRAGLVRAFQKLRCVQPDPTRPRWVWLYDYEARGLPLPRPYAQLPKELHPIVIGSFFPRGDRVVLDLRSFERAGLPIPFFDRHVPRRVLRVTDAEVVNRMFTGEEPATSPDQIFDRQETRAHDPEDLVRFLEEIVAPIQDPGERLRVASEHMEARARQPLPEVERLPLRFYEEGIEPFKTALTLRQMIALQHWQGNTAYSMADVIRTIMAGRQNPGAPGAGK